MWSSMRIWALWRRYRYIKNSHGIAERYFCSRQEFHNSYEIKLKCSWFTKKKKCDLTWKMAGHLAMSFTDCLLSPSSFDFCQRKSLYSMVSSMAGLVQRKNCIAFEIAGSCRSLYKAETLLGRSCSLSKIWDPRWTQQQMEGSTMFFITW